MKRAIEIDGSWLNRNVVAIAFTSLLSDVGHEMATALLPGFFALLGLPAAALGGIEGLADATASFTKLGSGWFSDRLGHRKALATSGYALTGMSKALFAFAHGWPLVLVGRTLGWFGRGGRTPLRNAILAESVSAQARGRAFGFERAGDSLGAVIGPLLAVGLLAYFQQGSHEPSRPFRCVFLLTVIPGLSAALAFGTLVRAKRRASATMKFSTAMGSMPGSFRRLLWSIGTFGMGDFAHTLMILAATQLLSANHSVGRASEIAGILYVAHNLSNAGASYPIGAFSDRWTRREMLGIGYFLGAVTAAGFVAAFHWKLATLPVLFVLFALGGVYLAFVETLEAALTAV